MELVIPTEPPKKIYIRKDNSYEGFYLDIEGYNYLQNNIMNVANTAIAMAGGVTGTAIDCGTF